MIKKILASSITPAIMIGYYLTENAAFLTLFSVLNVLLLCVLCVCVIAFNVAIKKFDVIKDPALSLGLIESACKAKNASLLTKLHAHLQWIVIISLLAYWGAFIPLATYLVNIALVLVLQTQFDAIIKTASKYAASCDMTLDQLIVKIKAALKQESPATLEM